jgi:hypothetical protein
MIFWSAASSRRFVTHRPVDVGVYRRQVASKKSGDKSPHSKKIFDLCFDGNDPKTQVRTALEERNLQGERPRDPQFFQGYF